VHKVALNVGGRDARTGEFVLKGGLSEGDNLLRYPTTALSDGQVVEMAGEAHSPTVLAEQSGK
jgi:hypothetical protein